MSGGFETGRSRIGGRPDLFEIPPFRFFALRNAHQPGAPSLRGFLRKGGIPQSPPSRDSLVGLDDRRAGGAPLLTLFEKWPAMLPPPRFWLSAGHFSKARSGAPGRRLPPQSGVIVTAQVNALFNLK
jgi:hypothetical protein